MNHTMRLLYDHLPARLRSVAASTHGYSLRRWRYGRDTELLVERSLESDRWTHQQWMAWHADRLSRILRRAATCVPFYRSFWQTGRRQGNPDSWRRLENWPILEKEPVRQDPGSFVATGCRPDRLHLEHTSGTTGTPLNLWQSRDMLRCWYALFEARCRRWYGVSRGDRWAMLGGQVVTPVGRRRPPFWVWNAALNQLYMSNYHLAADCIPHYLEALRRYRIVHLLGYTSSLHALAREAIRLGRDDLRMKVAVANGEPVYEYQRRAIGAAFHCPVRETYGMAEKVAAASECEHGRLHVWPEAGWIEVLENGRPVEPGSSGDLVITGLLNLEMPLVRYRVGDRGRLARPGTSCPCGRSLPLLLSLDGRTDDVLQTRDGRRVPQMDPCFKDDLPIREAQVVQETLENLRILYVPARGFNATHRQAMIEHYRARMGEVQVILEEVPQVPRGANGKFQAVVCKLSR
ncbi:MAG: phenylacetate--CoA ligase family protein [Pirellulales bacterium]|nr:phenylacetate--CoA ligase family protein [Pirellulales bacterium]